MIKYQTCNVKEKQNMAVSLAAPAPVLSPQFMDPINPLTVKVL